MLKKGMVAAIVVMFSLVASVVQAANWYTWGDWVMKDGDTSANRFFAIGVWPKYGATLYSAQYLPGNFNNFNVIYLDRDQERPWWMSNEWTWMIGGLNFSWFYQGGTNGGYNPPRVLTGYSNPDWGINTSEMQTLRSISINQPTTIKNFIKTYSVYPWRDSLEARNITNFIWECVGEAEYGAENGRHNWCWYPEILQRYYQSIREEFGETPSLVTLGLGPVATWYSDGAASGNYLFYEMSGATLYNLENYYSNQYVRNGTSSEYASGNLSGYYLSNTTQLASLFQNAQNVMMINSYGYFMSDPGNAGRVVGALQSGITYNSKPVWMWFNVGDMDSEANLKKVKCQMFAAIVRGCTGVFFYAPEAPDVNFGYYAQSLAQQLKDMTHIFTGTEITRSTHSLYDCIFYSVRQSASTGKKYLICVNTSGSSLYVNYDNFSGFTFHIPSQSLPLPPYGVNVASEDGTFISSKIATPFGPETDSERPKEVIVSVNPNPFNPETTITYTLDQASHVTLDIFSITGQKVRTLVNENHQAGTHSAKFIAKGLSSGVYLYRLSSNGMTKTGTLTYMK